MEVLFRDDDLERIYIDPTYDGKYSQSLVRAFRKTMQVIIAGVDERTFYSMKSLHFEKLKGNRSHQYSMRLNDQWRLSLEISGTSPNKVIEIIGLEDYH